MKVLWFANTPSLAEEILSQKPSSGGWIKTLDKELQNRIELNVAFIHHKKLNPFLYGQTWYFPIYQKKAKLDVILDYLLPTRNDTTILSECVDIINRINPDLVHIHGTESVFAQIAMQIDKPVVFSIQGIVSVIKDTYHHLKKPGLLHPIQKWSYNVYSKRAEFEKKALANSKYLISKSGWSNNVLSVLSPNAQIFNIDNIMRDNFYENEWNQTSLLRKKLILTSIVADKYFKGLDNVIQVAGYLSELNIDFEWKLIGINERSRMLRYVKKAYKIKHIAKQIIFLDKQTETEIIDIFKETSIYVMVSHIENSPNNLTEALMIGVPSITVNVGGVSSFVLNEVNGLIVPDYDPFNLAGTILNLFNNKEQMKLLSLNARKMSLTKHRRELIVNNMIDIYSKIVNTDCNFK